MGKSSRRPHGTSRMAGSSRNSRERRTRQSGSEEAIKAAEHVALAAFGTGLRLAAAFGTVAAKTASVALSSLASGADKFSELVREEVSAPRKTSSRKATYSRARKHPRVKNRTRVEG